MHTNLRVRKVLVSRGGVRFIGDVENLLNFIAPKPNVDFYSYRTTIDDVLHSVYLPHVRTVNGKTYMESDWMDICISPDVRIETNYADRRYFKCWPVISDYNHSDSIPMNDASGEPLKVIHAHVSEYCDGSYHDIHIYYDETDTPPTPRDVNKLFMIPPPEAYGKAFWDSVSSDHAV